MVGEMMLKTGQHKIAEETGLLPFSVKVLAPERTICEKIMSLVRFSYGDNPIEDLQNKIRHTYDVHQLLKQKEFSDFLDSSEFDKMLLKVAEDDVVSFKNNNEWLNIHPSEALIFKELDALWEKLKPVYNRVFKKLVYGILPSDDDVLNTLQRIKARLEKVSWTIDVCNEAKQL
jgi:hypothetical protein